MTRDRFGYFGLNSKNSLTELNNGIYCRGGIISWGGRVNTYGKIHSHEGSVIGDCGIRSFSEGIRAYGDVISWKGEVEAAKGVESVRGEIFARKIFSDGGVSAGKIKSNLILAGYVCCDIVSGIDASPVIEIKRSPMNKTERSCYIGSYIRALFGEK